MTHSKFHPWHQHYEKVSAILKPVQDRLEKVPEYAESLAGPYDISFKLKDKKFPYSCTDEEGLMIYLTILENNLKSGFEIATAFGYSSLYIGLAMKQTQGKCISIDCYVEEFKESYHYNPDELIKAVNQVRSLISEGVLPVGLRTAKAHTQLLGLETTLDFQVGISPADIGKLIENRTLDFAFIDGGHFGDQPTQDFLAIAPYLSDTCAVLFHDNNYNRSVYHAVEKAEKYLKSPAIRTQTRHNLTLVGRNLNSSFTKLFKSFPYRQNTFREMIRYQKWANKQKIKQLLNR